MRFISVLVCLTFLVGLTGCATTTKQKDLEVQGLKNQLNVLQSKISEKDDEINGLRDALTKATAEVSKPTDDQSGEQASVKTPTIKQIQQALKNAGFNPGSVDGRMGKQTRVAIREFQKANNLNVDGKVGKQTWSILEPFLNKSDSVK